MVGWYEIGQGKAGQGRIGYALAHLSAPQPPPWVVWGPRAVWRAPPRHSQPTAMSSTQPEPRSAGAALAFTS